MELRGGLVGKEGHELIEPFIHRTYALLGIDVKISGQVVSFIEIGI